MSKTLPPGFLKDCSVFEENSEGIGASPLDIENVIRFWKAYNTLSRNMGGSTATRLGNFWWRIWGSQRRELNSATIGTLFHPISSGESFVPLQDALPRPTKLPVSILKTGKSTKRGGLSIGFILPTDPKAEPEPHCQVSTPSNAFGRLGPRTTKLPISVPVRDMYKGRGKGPEEFNQAEMFGKKPVLRISEPATKSQIGQLLEKARAAGTKNDHI